MVFKDRNEATNVKILICFTFWAWTFSLTSEFSCFSMCQHTEFKVHLSSQRLIKWLSIYTVAPRSPAVSKVPPTFHECGVGPAVVVEVRAMDVPQAVLSQLRGVAQTLKDGVHETLEIRDTIQTQLLVSAGQSEKRWAGDTYCVPQVPQSHQALRTLVLFKENERRSHSCLGLTAREQHTAREQQSSCEGSKKPSEQSPNLTLTTRSISAFNICIILTTSTSNKVIFCLPSDCVKEGTMNIVITRFHMEPFGLIMRPRQPYGPNWVKMGHAQLWCAAKMNISSSWWTTWQAYDGRLRQCVSRDAEKSSTEILHNITWCCVKLFTTWVKYIHFWNIWYRRYCGCYHL